MPNCLKIPAELVALIFQRAISTALAGRFLVMSVPLAGELSKETEVVTKPASATGGGVVPGAVTQLLAIVLPFGQSGSTTPPGAVAQLLAIVLPFGQSGSVGGGVTGAQLLDTGLPFGQSAPPDGGGGVTNAMLL